MKKSRKTAGRESKAVAHAPRERRVYRCFVMMPFGKAFNRVFDIGILGASTLLRSHKVHFYHAEESLLHFELRENVMRHIDNADFCLADTTGLNPNVLWEIGYAMKGGKDVVIITQNIDEYPVDLSSIIRLEYSMKTDKDLQWFSQGIVNACKKAIEFLDRRERTRTYTSVYKITCFENREHAKLGQAFRDAQERIDILQTNLETVRDRYFADIKDALSKNPKVVLRILTLDPDSFYTAPRADQLGLQVGHYRAMLHDHIRFLLKKLSNFGERFALRVYNDFPTQITFIIDGSVYTCTIAQARRSRELCIFKLNRLDAGAERSFISHFQTMWVSAYSYSA